MPKIKIVMPMDEVTDHKAGCFYMTKRRMRFVICLVLLLPLTACLSNEKIGTLFPARILKSSASPSELTEIPGFSDVTNSLGMKFVLLDAGSFTMGSPPLEADRDADEIPHTVTLTKAFYMQTTEVTQGQWVAIMKTNPSKFSGDTFLPVEQVSWNDVQTFIQKLNEKNEGQYRLPTEAEWEFAARAGTSTAYYCGNSASCLDKTDWVLKYEGELGGIDWFYRMKESKTNLVGQKFENGWFLYDMHGNVSEWVQDWYSDYPNSAVTDPVGPSTGSDRVSRGGSWYIGSKFARSANRFKDTPDTGIKDLGFRLVYKP